MNSSTGPGPCAGYEHALVDLLEGALPPGITADRRVRDRRSDAQRRLEERRQGPRRPSDGTPGT